MSRRLLRQMAQIAEAGPPPAATLVMPDTSKGPRPETIQTVDSPTGIYQVPHYRFDFSTRPVEMRRWIVRSDPTIIEAGCNDGTDTLRMLQIFPGARLFCFEPDPRPRERFLRRFGDDPQVILIPMALGDKAGERTFYGSSGNPPEPQSVRPEWRTDWDLSGSLLPPKGHVSFSPWVTFPEDAEHRFEVEVTTLDEWLAGHPEIDRIDLLWADVQGAESLLVAGAQRALGITRYFYTEIYDEELYAGQIDKARLSAALPGFAVAGVYAGDNVLYANLAMEAACLPKLGNFSPRTTKQAITMRKLGRYGQWGNQIVQYLFVRLYAQMHGLDYGVPAWGGQYLFGFDDPEVRKKLPSAVEPLVPGNPHNACFGKAIPPSGTEYVGRDFQGWAQYDTYWYAPHKEFIKSLYAEPAEPQRSRVYAALDKLRSKGDTVISLHLRRGDSGRMIFFFTPIAWCLHWLHRHWRRFQNPVLFLSTEDESLKEYFRGYSVVAVEDLGIKLQAEPYPQYAYQFDVRPDRARQLDFFPDWFLLQQSDIVLASDSSFSVTAAWTSRTVRELWRPRLSLKAFELLDPWNMPFCNREHLDDFPGIPGTQIDGNEKDFWGNFKPTYKSIPEDPESFKQWLEPPR